MKSDLKDLKNLIRQGERYNLEFKEAFNDSLGKEICAMANANGGKILLGVSDTGEIKGVHITNRSKSQIQDIVRNFDPIFQVSFKDIVNILVINVPEGSNKPYAVAGKYFLRNGPNSQQLKRDEIRQFFEKEGLIFFDEKVNKTFDVARDFNAASYRRFLKLAGLPKDINKDHILNNLEILEGRHLKNAGVLLFCKTITKHIRQATIICSVFQGTDKYKIIDSKEFASDLYSNYTEALNYLKSKLNTEYIIKGGPREEVLELPEEALREALLNAIAHRNYFMTASIQVYIFSDRVEFVNPGGLVSGFKLSDLGKRSMPRNILLFGLMQRMDLVERIGSGILRIHNAMKEYRLPAPVIEADADWFSVTFKRPDLQIQTFEERSRPVDRPIDGVKDMVNDRVKDRIKLLSVQEKRIIKLITANPKITALELAAALKINERNTRAHLAKLGKKNLLTRAGSDKSGYWQVKE